MQISIGLSGLITPSLDEMVNVAGEMQREGLDIPLLIGGATTSKIHTAIRIEPAYDGPTIHVKDASRSVGVVSNLLSSENRQEFVEQTREEYSEIRERRSKTQTQTRLLPFKVAQQRRLTLDWQNYVPPKPNKLGVKVFSDFPLRQTDPLY